jgi:hypothetical protein
MAPHSCLSTHSCAHTNSRLRVLAPQAEHFDVGGEGLTYHRERLALAEALPPNAIRLEELGAPVAVQINDVSATEGAAALSVGTAGGTGEWLRFSVNATSGGAYLPKWRIAAHSAAGALAVEAHMTVGTGAEASPCAAAGGGGLELAAVDTGGRQQFMSFRSQTPISIPAGQSVLTVCFGECLCMVVVAVLLLRSAGVGCACWVACCC